MNGRERILQLQNRLRDRSDSIKCNAIHSSNPRRRENGAGQFEELRFRSRRPKELPPKSTKAANTRHSANYQSIVLKKKFKNSKTKEVRNLQGTASWGFVSTNFTSQKGVVRSSQSAERERCAAKNTLSSKAAIQNRRDKQLPNKVKLKEFITSKPALQGMLEGNL